MLTYEDLGTYPTERWREVLHALRRQFGEESAADFYERIRLNAEARRKANPGAYVLPPGHTLYVPPSHPRHCPECGHEL